MEGNEITWELNSASALLHFFTNIMSSSCSETISHLSANPLFSCIITVYTLILLYFPQAFKIFLSPVLILTALLLLFLLRLGAVQRLQTPDPDKNDIQENVESVQNREDCFGGEEKNVLLTAVDKWVETGFRQNPSKPDFEDSFVEWNVRAPLEVIYEAYYEGEEDEDNQKNETRTSGLERYPSLSMYYPETDSDSSSDGSFSATGEWDSPESVCFRWEEEDRDGLLIEIALDHNNVKKQSGLGVDMDTGFHVEEDNLIEIDLSPPKNDAFSGEV